MWWIGGKEDNFNLGNVQTKNRPHLIVSNDIGNRTSNTLIVIPFTLETKPDLPTHYICEFNGKKNTLLTEQIRTVNNDELMTYMFMLDDKTMEEIDKVIMLSLGIVDKNKKYMINEKHTYEPSLYQCVKNDISDFANERILFNTNKRGRIWNNESKMEFINYVKTYGLEKASIKYNTKTNTKQYYSRFCKSLNITEDEVK